MKMAILFGVASSPNGIIKEDTMNITMKPTVTSSEIEREFGIRVFDCAFAQEVGNDSYITLWLDDAQTKELWEEINDCADEEKYVKRLKNELELINRFRELGYKDSILVFVSW